jgi:hypothetical protein
MNVRNYRFLIVLIAVGIITVFSFPALATDVGGIIDTDTTWDLAGHRTISQQRFRLQKG